MRCLIIKLFLYIFQENCRYLYEIRYKYLLSVTVGAKVKIEYSTQQTRVEWTEVTTTELSKIVKIS